MLHIKLLIAYSAHNCLILEYFLHIFTAVHFAQALHILCIFSAYLCIFVQISELHILTYLMHTCTSDCICFENKCSQLHIYCIFYANSCMLLHTCSIFMHIQCI
jgi:hypothetical protein